MKKIKNYRPDEKALPPLLDKDKERQRLDSIRREKEKLEAERKHQKEFDKTLKGIQGEEEE